MSKDTSIEWADSTLNLQMGCDGCELWNLKAGVKRCYAGTLTERYGGRKGYPASFDQPALFPHRLDEALRWKDLTGTHRPKKPWLSGLPRMIFLDDMGDTFTESLPLDWLAPHLPRMAASPHHYMLLTKRGSRMRQFSERYPLPPNVWPGVSVTSQRTAKRIDELLKVKGGGPKWVSAEPLWERVDLTPWLAGLRLVIVGGESGPGASPCDLDWIEDLLRQCYGADVARFVKQLGSRPTSLGGDLNPPLKDAKGGDPAEWPWKMIREFPEFKHAA